MALYQCAAHRGQLHRGGPGARKETQAMTETLAEAPFATTDGPQRHASYAALAATAPVHRITLPTGQSAWLITGYNEARHALADPRLVKSEVTAANTGRGLLPGEVYAAMGSHMLNRNP